MSSKVAKYFIKQLHKYRMYMNFIQRIERNMKRDFPEITLEELKERINLIKHMIAISRQSNSKRKESTI